MPDTVQDSSNPNPNGLNRASNKIGAAGPLDALYQNPFNTSNFSYPVDISDLAHAMLFNINVFDPNSASAQNPSTPAGAATASRSQKLRQGTLQGQSASTLLGTDVQLPSIGDTQLPAPTLNRKTKRIQTSIGLYVPETLVFDDSQNYEPTSILDLLGAGGAALAVGAATGGTLGSALKAGGIGAIFATALGLDIGEDKLNQLVNPSGGAQTAIKAMFGYAINPVVEVIYSSPKLRNFQFDFIFAPRNMEEAESVWQIVYQFRRHQAPSFASVGKIGGAFFSPPSEFDITFLRRDIQTGSFVQNGNIPGISTCVLTSMSTNFAPENQFTTHVDGFPTHIRMMLQFTEVDIITRERVDIGF